jgi:hypothetical protein
MDAIDDASDSLEDDMHSAKGMGGPRADGMPNLQSGRVVLVVPDIELVEFFRQQVCMSVKRERERERERERACLPLSLRVNISRASLPFYDPHAVLSPAPMCTPQIRPPTPQN